MNEFEKLKTWVKENIPNAEIMEIIHTKRIFSDDAKCSQPLKEGVIITITNSF